MAVPSTLRLPDGRTLAYDDVGHPAGAPILYLHGTPDSRLARPPDHLTTAAGVRLVAVDRPGMGDSDPHPGGGLRALGLDLTALLDDLGVARAILLGWSAGGLFALAAAADLGERVAGIGVVAAVPPVEAYEDAGVVAALGPGRRAFVDLAREVPARELAAEVAPYLVPDPFTPQTAREHVLESAGERGQVDLAAVPGAVDALVAGLAASVQQGRDGLQHDIALQLEPGIDVSRITAPVRAFHGTDDEISPAEVGAWLVSRLPNAVLDLSQGASHHLLFAHWRGILRALRRDAAI